MQFPLNSKLEKVISKDSSRPALAAAYLRIESDGSAFLEATTSYVLATIPVTIDETDVAGFVPAEALAAARKAKQGELACNGSVTAPRGDSYPRYDGQFPDSSRLYPEAPPTFTVGINARFLYDIAQALGSDIVVLRFQGDAAGANPLKAIIVEPANGTGVSGARGLAMPVRVDGERSEVGR